MPHHFTKSTVYASAWCNPCGKNTQHRIDDGRRGPCTECMAKQQNKINQRQAKILQPIPAQMDLFK